MNGAELTLDTDRKSRALEALGCDLCSYAELQSAYTQSIHSPDYKSFGRSWDESLYSAIRSCCGNLEPGNPPRSLLYLGPGAHAPLLLSATGDSLGLCYERITLADIDAGSLTSAVEAVKQRLPVGLILGRVADLTGGLGQRLADAFADALEGASSATDIDKNLNPATQVIDQVFDPGFCEGARHRVVQELSSDGGGCQHSVVVSEMIASFTGTAVWLAFRSVLFERYKRFAAEQDLNSCLSRGLEILRLYNAVFLKFHIHVLSALTAEGGHIVLAFDVSKLYDDARHYSQISFPGDPLPPHLLEESGFMTLERRRIIWRDHPISVHASVGGIAVPDFDAHQHEVELVTLSRIAL